MAAWDSSAHPRVQAGGAGGGEFAPGGGASGSAKGAKASKGTKAAAAAARPTPTNQHPVGTGEHGKRVSDLQERLNALGAKPPLKVDGTFGPKTLAAVRQFQKAHGLKVDGLVGPKTTAALRQPAARAPVRKAPVHRAQTWASRWAQGWAPDAEADGGG